ncbi:hypothetical protein F5Y18DRAFT_419114 [Xylariaceae sp. FL1019]|nr:hypothetical protein F5Y18DRAFT_419114 [Xylariaceae sp. FL1019]
MCLYYYLHYHHQAGCTREIEYRIAYSFCEHSTMASVFYNPLSPLGSSPTSQGADAQMEEQPCANLEPAPEWDPAIGFDYTNPCASGGCLMSQECVSGGCRLEDLGGRWICCRCKRGGNTFKCCYHRLRKVPDALCDHKICRNCRTDA